MRSLGKRVCRKASRVRIPPSPQNFTFCEIVRNSLGAKRLGMVFFRYNPSINQDDVEQLLILLPTLEIQNKLVAEAEKEQQIINASKQLIEIYEQKIAAVLNEI